MNKKEAKRLKRQKKLKERDRLERQKIADRTDDVKKLSGLSAEDRQLLLSRCVGSEIYDPDDDNADLLDLEDLEAIPGIGPKTARCFLIHSRPDQQYAGLDTHVLKFLRDKGHEVPASTPTGKKYKELEKVFLQYAAESGMTVADFDLAIWNQYRSVKR